jgi:hypothetical protein
MVVRTGQPRPSFLDPGQVGQLLEHTACKPAPRTTRLVDFVLGLRQIHPL